MRVLRFNTLILLVVVFVLNNDVNQVEANYYSVGSSSHENLNMEKKCFSKCVNECLLEHTCEPSIFLTHCLDICEIVCSYQIHPPPGSSTSVFP